MVTFITIMHVLVCVFLMIVVLLQHGKGADMGATFGGASQTVFGARGATTILSKITVGAAFTFMCTSIGLAYMSSSGAAKSILEKEKSAKQTQSLPVQTPIGSVAPAEVPSPIATVVPTVAATPNPARK